MKKRDMTEGGIADNLIRFALPLLAGNLFQQLYNIVDTWVIGQSHDNAAYAAVGSIGPIVNILVGFFSGLATGAGVVISQYFGARREDMVKKTVHTSTALTLVLMVLFTAIGTVFAPKLATLMLATDNVDPAVVTCATDYLTIYFAGVSALMIYNMGAGILRAIGDSDRPFYYLVVTTVINIALDLLFVFKWGMGTKGVALATIIAQAVSAVMIVITLLRTETCVKLVPREIRFDREILKNVLVIGLPFAVQTAITAFSNVFVQSYIAGANGEQAINLSSWTSYSKIDSFIFLPLTSLSLAISTFVGQNLGKGDLKRAKRGTLVGFYIALTVTLTIILTVELFAPFLARVFNPDPVVVHNATVLLRFITPFFLCSCVNQSLLGALRGSGDSTAAMIISVGAFVGFRQLYLFILTKFISNDLYPIGTGYLAGWFVCSIAVTIYFFSCDFGSKVIVKKEENAAEN